MCACLFVIGPGHDFKLPARPEHDVKLFSSPLGLRGLRLACIVSDTVWARIQATVAQLLPDEVWFSAVPTGERNTGPCSSGTSMLLALQLLLGALGHIPVP
eukprot:6490229-Amphidinium_carterae.1